LRKYYANPGFLCPKSKRPVWWFLVPRCGNCYARFEVVRV
jgi:hypothetical protein